jgi:fumarylpyruvate hydrolase
MAHARIHHRPTARCRRAGAEQQCSFPCSAHFCVGRNYAEHAIEMGSDPTREPPFYFTKPADAVLTRAPTCPIPP